MRSILGAARQPTEVVQPSLRLGPLDTHEQTSLTNGIVDTRYSKPHQSLQLTKGLVDGNSSCAQRSRRLEDITLTGDQIGRLFVEYENLSVALLRTIEICLGTSSNIIAFLVFSIHPVALMKSTTSRHSCSGLL